MTLFSSAQHPLLTILAITLWLVAMPSFGQTVDTQGAKLLHEEATRARRLRELEYQATLLEQQARIAKARSQLDTAVGLNQQQPPVSVPIKAVAKPSAFKPVLRSKAVKTEPKPTRLVHMVNGRAAIMLSDQRVYWLSVGEHLPGGEQLVEMSYQQGVTLERAGVVQRLQMELAPGPNNAVHYSQGGR